VDAAVSRNEESEDPGGVPSDFALDSDPSAMCDPPPAKSPSSSGARALPVAVKPLEQIRHHLLDTTDQCKIHYPA
jgi:hypothetical protein